jgi:DNA-binding NtrC family response regulator
MPTILIIDDEVVLARNLVKIFARHGFDAHHAGAIADARRVYASAPVDVVLLDLRLPDGSGLELLEWLVAADANLPVIMMTAHGSIADAVVAMQRTQAQIG